MTVRRTGNEEWSARSEARSCCLGIGRERRFGPGDTLESYSAFRWSRLANLGFTIGARTWRTPRTGKSRIALKVAAGIPAAQVTSRDFRAILSIHDLTPELRGSGSGYRTIRAYYSIVEEIGRLIPSLTGWAESEMTLCTRYAAVLVDQRLERNMRLRGPIARDIAHSNRQNIAPLFQPCEASTDIPSRRKRNY